MKRNEGDQKVTKTKLSKAPNIPGFSLAKQNAELREQLLQVLAGVIDSGKFILGENVRALEEEIAAYCGARYAVGVASGSDALYLSLLACGIGPGDEVITMPFTFFATAGAIARAGATLVFVDIDPETWNLDPAGVAARITPRTRAVIPVHLYGCPADMDPILALAAKHGLKVIEDAAQALGAVYKGKRVGTLGDAGCLSFFPTKNLGGFGDGGMVVTDDPDIADRVRLLRVHGARPKYHHHLLGLNSRLDELQAAVLRLKLPYLEGWNKRRQEIAALYERLLRPVAERVGDELKLPAAPDYAVHVYHQYTLQTPRRDELHTFLEAHGVGTAVYYPLPLHLQPVFASLGYRERDFPAAEAASRQVLSLPMFPELTDEEAAYVAGRMAAFFGL
jgi:dTDP-4-amino-4,6-dideoxygalactose transaminase